MTKLSEPSGLLLLNKPAGVTSFDCIRRLRHQTGVRKIGHAGTLDPMAEGLMLMLFGKATKQADRFLRLDKDYTGEVTLGASSSTGDIEGDLTVVSEKVPTEAEVKAAIREFTGTITQTPPQYSAIKIGGVPAYKLARQGKRVDIQPREVTVYNLELVSYRYPKLELVAKVSSGTYIRTLAEDIGGVLGTAAHLSALRRDRIGDLKLEMARDINSVDRDSLNTYLINAATA